MSLIQILLTEGKKDIMIDKIGIPEELADVIVQKFPKKYHIWLANNMMVSALSTEYDISMDNLLDYSKAKARYDSGEKKDKIDDVLIHYAMRLKREDYFYYRYYYFIHGILQVNEMPNMNLKNIMDYWDVSHITEDFTRVRDYLESATPKPNLSSLTWDEAVNRAYDWHEQLESTGRALEIEEGQIVVKQYEDGYYWLDLNTNKCQAEGGSMGHCGNTSADTLLSLRDPKGEPHVTIAYNYNGVYNQIKGKENKKPIEKYHPYIVDLYTESHTPDDTDHSYQLTDYESEHDPHADFNLFDLGEDLFEEYKSKTDEEGFISLLIDIDYETLLKSIDYENVNINVNSKDPRYLKAFTADNYNKEGFIDLLIKYNFLKEEYRDIEHITNIQYPNVNVNSKMALLEALYNNEDIVLLRIMTEHFSEDMFYKRK